MRNRPLPYFTRFIRKESPLDSEIDKLIKIYNKGGLKKYVGDDITRLADVRIEQVCYTDPITRERLTWVYVGNSWWCRKRKTGDYEFARMVALVNPLAKKLISNTNDTAVINNTKYEVDGLWDCRRHAHRPDPEIVYRNGVKGYVIGNNQYELVVEWEVGGTRGNAELVKNILDIEFEFSDDKKKYSRLLKIK